MQVGFVPIRIRYLHLLSMLDNFNKSRIYNETFFKATGWCFAVELLAEQSIMDEIRNQLIRCTGSDDGRRRARGAGREPGVVTPPVASPSTCSCSPSSAAVARSALLAVDWYTGPVEVAL